MNHFCTLFDSNYLPRGLVLYQSLLDTKEDFFLYVVCFDDLAFDILNKLNLERLKPIKLGEFENDALLKVKQERTAGEYCWTCTPHVIRYVLDTYNLEQVTYLDADLCFYNKPSILLNELKHANGSILITEHRYTPKYDQSNTSGKYCVQFMTFNADEYGLTALEWWQERCLEWCFNRHEDGKFGDQKYLDDWTLRFKGVHVLEHLGGGVAPWNVQQYKVSVAGEKLYVNNFPLVFYHYHGYKYYRNGLHDLVRGYVLSKDVVEFLYRPYGKSLLKAYERIFEVDSTFDKGWATTEVSFIEWTKYFRCVLIGVANRYKLVR